MTLFFILQLRPLARLLALHRLNNGLHVLRNSLRIRFFNPVCNA